MKQLQSPHIRWPEALSLLLFFGFCPTCKRAASSDTPNVGSAPAPATPSAAPAVAALPGASQVNPTSVCAGKYQGQYSVTRIKSDLTRKDGAPEKWDSDDGHTLAGTGELTLEVDAQSVIVGTSQGALGELTLRGACDASTLRALLDSKVDSSESIQNAYLVADLNGAEASGTIAAATGDSQIRRTGTVSLKKLP